MSRKRRESELSQMKYFGRVLRLVWPHRKYLLVAMLSMIGVATAYTFSIATLYPVLQMLLKKENPANMVSLYVVQQRLDVDIVSMSIENETLESKLGRRGMIITNIDESTPLYKQGVRIGDYIASINAPAEQATTQNSTALTPKVNQGWPMINQLANLEKVDEVTLNIYSPSNQTLRSLTTEYDAPKWYDTSLLKAMSYIQPNYDELKAGQMNPQLKMLIWILGFLALLSLFGNISRFFGEYYGAIVGARTLIDLRRKMYAKVMMLPMSFFVTRGVSDTMSRFMQDSQDVLKALKVLFGKVLREPLKAAGALIVALSIEPRLTLILIIVAPLAGVMFRKFGKWIRKANEKMLIGYGRLIGALESTLSGIRVVKAYTMENRERKRYFKVEREILRQNLKIEKINALTSPILEVIGTVALSSGVVWVFAQILDGKIESASLLVLMATMVAIMDPIRKLSNVYTDLQRANAAAKRIFELIDMKTEFETSAGTKQAFEPKSKIEFKDVTFNYPNSDHPAIKDVTLSIEAGKIYAIVGPNGSGKTTLASLLLRLFDPQSGQVAWDNIDIKDFNLRSLRNQISYVSQDAVIFADSVENNIAYGNYKATKEEIMTAAKRAHAHEFIERLPQGYDTILGEHGTSLSGGERQRLSIARAILRNAPILILDEATSQIDADSEHKIQQAIDEFLPGRTAVMIAHRFSTIKKADKIVVMDRSEIVACGSHQELIESSPLYQSLYQTQLKGLQQNG